MSNLTLYQAMSPFIKENNPEMEKIFNQNYMNMLQVQAQKQGIPPEHVKNFIMKAVLKGADPRKDEVYLVPRYTKNGIVGTVLFSKHFLINKANETGEFTPITTTFEVEEVFNPITGDDERQLVATAKSIRIKNGKEYSVQYKAYWKEYFDAKSPIWKSKPHVMLGKCAEAGLLRVAFPETTSNVFLKEEFNDILNENEAAEIIESQKIEQEKTENIIQKAHEDRAKKSDIIEAIRELSGKITASYSLAKKGEYMINQLEVQKFDQLKNKTISDLKEILDKIKQIEIEPVVLAKDEDLPY